MLAYEVEIMDHARSSICTCISNGFLMSILQERVSNGFLMFILQEIASNGFYSFFIAMSAILPLAQKAEVFIDFALVQGIVSSYHSSPPPSSNQRICLHSIKQIKYTKHNTVHCPPRSRPCSQLH